MIDITIQQILQSCGRLIVYISNLNLNQKRGYQKLNNYLDEVAEMLLLFLCKKRGEIWTILK